MASGVTNKVVALYLGVNDISLASGPHRAVPGFVICDLVIFKYHQKMPTT